MGAVMIEGVRSFNRRVTDRIGALNDQYMGRARPLGEARLLWEIGPGGSEVRDPRRGLGLDSGYVARLLRSLEEQRLVVASRAREIAVSVLESLDDDERTRLLTAMRRSNACSSLRR